MRKLRSDCKVDPGKMVIFAGQLTDTDLLEDDYTPQWFNDMHLFDFGTIGGL